MCLARLLRHANPDDVALYDLALYHGNTADDPVHGSDEVRRLRYRTYSSPRWPREPHIARNGARHWRWVSTNTVVAVEILGFFISIQCAVAFTFSPRSARLSSECRRLTPLAPFS